MQIKEYSAFWINSSQLYSIRPWKSSEKVYEGLKFYRFMRETTCQVTREKIYALSCTVEWDLDILKTLNEENLWENSSNWIKKILYWEINAYNKITFAHKFSKKLRTNARSNQEESKEEINCEISQYLQLDNIHKTVLAVEENNIYLCCESTAFIFNLGSGYLKKETFSIPERTIGYSYDSKSFWFIEDVSPENVVQINAFQIKKIEK